jgi:hypothetical protein
VPAIYERPIPGRRNAPATLAATIILAVVGFVGSPSAASAENSVIAVTVTSQNGTPPVAIAPIPTGAVAAPQNTDILGQDTTFVTYAGPALGSPRAAESVGYGAYNGMSFAQLAKLVGVSPQNLVPGNDAVEVADQSSANPDAHITLSKTEVISGFSDPCEAASFICANNEPADTTPNFAFIESTDEGIIVMRPMRAFGDFNGDNVIQTAFDGVLPVTFNTLGTTLTVGPAGQSATTVPVGGSVRFAAPTSVKLGTTQDPNPLTYTWTFGQGPDDTGSGAGPADVYRAPGTYSVFATVTDSLGNSGVSPSLVVTVPGPPPVKPLPPVVVQLPPPPPVPAPAAPTPKPVVVKPVSLPAVSHVVLKPAPVLLPATPGISKPLPNLSEHLTSAGGGSGSGTGSGNGVGAGTGAGGFSTGAAGGTGNSAEGVLVGGSATGGSPSATEGQTSEAVPSNKVSGLVGVLINPSGAASLSPATSRTTSQVATAARALAGGGRTVAVSWFGWFLGGLLVAVIVGGRALFEFEPRAAYRALRKR